VSFGPSFNREPPMRKSS